MDRLIMYMNASTQIFRYKYISTFCLQLIISDVSSMSNVILLCTNKCVVRYLPPTTMSFYYIHSILSLGKTCPVMFGQKAIFLLCSSTSRSSTYRFQKRELSENSMFSHLPCHTNEYLPKLPQFGLGILRDTRFRTGQPAARVPHGVTRAAGFQNQIKN